MKPAAYWRQSKTWQQWLGRTGTVIASTSIHVAPPQLAAFVPYSYVIVDFGSEKMEFMGAGQDELRVGDEVICVLRKLCVPSDEALIPYGIKVVKKAEA